MNRKRNGIACIAVATAALSAAYAAADPPNFDTQTAVLEAVKRSQRIEKLPVRVVDADGKPVADAKVTPWALRSALGHGLWPKDDGRTKVDPQDVFTDAEGKATVGYPYYHDVEEQIRTIAVSLQVDHPQFAYTDDVHIDLPLETDGPYVIKLDAGVPVEVRPLSGGVAGDLDSVFVQWSDGRSWRPGAAAEKLAGGVLQIPAMRPGKNSILLAKLDGGRATHFSKITDFELTVGEPKRIDIAMRPSARIRGVLSDNVPRPVREGRVKAWTLAPPEAGDDRVEWWTWTRIEHDGTFLIDGWPAGEPLQVIALCDGYMASYGSAPACIKNPPDPAKDGYNRPQVFEPGADEQIEVAMTPLARCVATAVDGDEKPLAGVTVESWPNVGWWNGLSQVYCHPLVRGERLLRDRAYYNSIDEAFGPPFSAETDAHGKATLQLPAGEEDLVVQSEVYELPVFLGRRDVEVNLVPGETTEAILRLQPRGTEKLGEWDKLAGVVFGCSTREGRRICALPGVRKQMDEFARRFRKAKNQRDPQLLSEAYAAVADAFVGVGDEEEAAKWREKAAEQAALVKAARTTDKKPTAE